jgi:CRP/FNR family cyclic AMP-dependent transcriptional regulator
MNEKITPASGSNCNHGSSPEQSIQTFLIEHPFLRGMTQHQLRIIGDCARQTHFEPNEVIFREGDPADRFYLIQRGKVALESYAKDTGMGLIQTIEAGEILGWSWLFPPCFWHFNARALEATDAIFVYGTILREECESDHDLGYELLKRMAEVMMRRLQATRRHLLELSGFPA